MKIAKLNWWLVSDADCNTPSQINLTFEDEKKNYNKKTLKTLLTNFFAKKYDGVNVYIVTSSDYRMRQDLHRYGAGEPEKISVFTDGTIAENLQF